MTNAAIERIEDLADVPLAYGLPRDEGFRLPYLVPEYEGAPIYDHERLPSVTPESLVDATLTVRDFDALQSPPADLPSRATGLVFQHAGRESEETADVSYELVPTSELEHIADFTGPQLSYEFAIPDFAEDAVASHISTTGAPWSQPRYENPAADVTDPNHRAELADRYDAIGEPAPVNTLVARVTQAVADDDAPDGAGLTTMETSVEAVALLESDPEAVPTFGGVAVVQDVPAGDHRLTVNGAGRAPHSEQVSVVDDGAVTAAGVDAEIPLVARERATKLEVAAENATADLVGVAVEDDFAGRLYDSTVDGNDAVYVHDGGAYTTEVRDADDAVGAYRVNPDPGSNAAVRIDRPETGKASLASFLADVAEETRADVEGEAEAREDEATAGASNAVRGLQRALAAVVEAARKAAERARAGDREGADKQLRTVSERLERVATRLSEASDDLPSSLSRAADKRLAQVEKRSEQARNSEKL
ncbi:hypothetical protein VB773_02510 [Haloarculaceae archaeon H-GB2-1]|nr:hypothetical protein [Haloarculaceae archaeon H-GB2-1]